ncbi:hypothetical protein K4749_11655 [Streptomyces sp. TRM72054]|uniref:hypothetical protein n=1 Tax=Streptomyces sp. TRM72054 TaxID=2870562 RepID=UPI001C8C04C6|nr:hypothetical protein [Streptomyces sp. TRM72054]MBX9394237.1 hypothetical protein [Streptomyces sp. TRM72054]
MKFPHALAAALAAGALLTGCSSHPGSSPGSGSSASPGPGEGEITSSATSSAPKAAATPSPSATADLDDWPNRPATSDKVPDAVPNAVIAKGYTGADYLARLTKRWHITLSARKKNDFDADDDRPAVWFSSGVAHPTAGTELSVAVVWSLDGDLKSLTCAAGRTAPGRADFLRQCVELDHPDAHPEAAARWLTTTTAAVDKLHDRTGKTVDSPLYRSGSAATVLVVYGAGKDGATYSLRVFGTAS